MSQRTSHSRREFMGSAALGAMAGASTMLHPTAVAAQAVGVKPGDLPDLTIKEVKAYVANVENVRKLNSPENGVIFSMVTNSGTEGNYTDGNRGNVPNWLEYAKATCVGKSLIDLLPMIPSSRPPTGRGGGRGRGPFIGGFGFGRGQQRGSAANVDLAAAYVDVCLWDILGKAVNRPIYKLLGGTKDRMIAYASGQHLANLEDFAPDALKAKEMGFKAYKIHPGTGQRRTGPQVPQYLRHIEEIKEVRKAVGDDFTLLFDPVQRYNVFEAIKVGRVLDEQGYVSFEDPIPSTDIAGLIELREKLDIPIEVGEFLYSIQDYGEHIRRGTLDIVRLIADNVGGISGSFRIGQLADAFGLPCTPHNWGNVMDLAVHLHLELALPNAFWVEIPMPPEATDRVYHKDKFRVDADGMIHAPTAPGLGYPIDRDALDKILIRVDR